MPFWAAENGRKKGENAAGAVPILLLSGIETGLSHMLAALLQ